jgi:hypothetical protein
VSLGIKVKRGSGAKKLSRSYQRAYVRLRSTPNGGGLCSLRISTIANPSTIRYSARLAGRSYTWPGWYISRDNPWILLVGWRRIRTFTYYLSASFSPFTGSAHPSRISMTAVASGTRMTSPTCHFDRPHR